MLLTYLIHRLILLLSNEMLWRLTSRCAVYVLLILTGSVKTQLGWSCNFCNPLIERLFLFPLLEDLVKIHQETLELWSKIKWHFVWTMDWLEPCWTRERCTSRFGFSGISSFFCFTAHLRRISYLPSLVCDLPVHSVQGSDTRIRTQKNPVGFFGYTHLKNPHFYFNLILVYTLYATNNAIFYCF